MNKSIAFFAIVLIAVSFYAVLNIDTLPILQNSLSSVQNGAEILRPVFELLS